MVLIWEDEIEKVLFVGAIENLRHPHFWCSNSVFVAPEWGTFTSLLWGIAQLRRAGKCQT
jgi:hypothetical protein